MLEYCLLWAFHIVVAMLDFLFIDSEHQAVTEDFNFLTKMVQESLSHKTGYMSKLHSTCLITHAYHKKLHRTVCNLEAFCLTIYFPRYIIWFKLSVFNSSKPLWLPKLIRCSIKIKIKLLFLANIVIIFSESEVDKFSHNCLQYSVWLCVIILVRFKIWFGYVAICNSNNFWILNING